MRLIQTATWGFLILYWILILYYFQYLPEQIPTHFNALGEADDHGSKLNIFLLPAIATMIVFGMGSIKRTKIDESAERTRLHKCDAHGNSLALQFGVFICWHQLPKHTNCV
jgi:uncharacterized membrane protein